MPRIEIVKVPENDRIPERIRRQWVGLQFEVADSAFMVSGIEYLKTREEKKRKAYRISYQVGLAALKKKNQIAWKYYRDNWPPLPEPFETLVKASRSLLKKLGLLDFYFHTRWCKVVR